MLKSSPKNEISFNILFTYSNTVRFFFSFAAHKRRYFDKGFCVVVFVYIQYKSIQNFLVTNFLPISSFVLCRNKRVIKVWNDMVSNWWLKFYFWVNHFFKANYCSRFISLFVAFQNVLELQYNSQKAVMISTDLVETIAYTPCISVFLCWWPFINCVLANRFFASNKYVAKISYSRC